MKCLLFQQNPLEAVHFTALSLYFPKFELSMFIREQKLNSYSGIEDQKCSEGTLHTATSKHITLPYGCQGWCSLIAWGQRHRSKECVERLQVCSLRCTDYMHVFTQTQQHTGWREKGIQGRTRGMASSTKCPHLSSNINDLWILGRSSHLLAVTRAQRDKAF